MHIVITMAGRGRRFRERGFDLPKYMIQVRGHTLFWWAMQSLQGFFEPAHTTFVLLREDQGLSFVVAECRACEIRNYDCVELERITDGQATTVLAAEPLLAARDSLLVYNIDTHVAPGYLEPKLVRGDGWVPCFPGEGSGWSFFRADAHGRVTDAREKVRISPHASVGCYYFRSFALYRRLYDELFAGPPTAGLPERYIAPLYSLMVRQGLEVYLHELPRHAVVPLGTPEEVNVFQNTETCCAGAHV